MALVNKGIVSNVLVIACCHHRLLLFKCNNKHGAQADSPSTTTTTTCLPSLQPPPLSKSLHERRFAVSRISYFVGWCVNNREADRAAANCGANGGCGEARSR